MNKTLPLVIFLFLFPINVYAHNPALFFTIAAAEVTFFSIPIFFAIWFFIKLITTPLKIKTRIVNFIVTWLLPFCIAIPIAIYLGIRIVIFYNMDINQEAYLIGFGLFIVSILELILIRNIAARRSNKALGEKYSKVKAISNYLKKCITGKERLWIVFWVWNLFVLYVVISFFPIIGIIFITPLFNPLPELSFIGIIQSTLLITSGILGGLLLLLSVAYPIWSFISCWRCSNNANNKIWYWLTRTYLTTLVVLTIYAYIPQ